MIASSAGRAAMNRRRLTLGAALPAAFLLGLLAAGANAQTAQTQQTTQTTSGTASSTDTKAQPGDVIVQGQKSTTKIDRETYDNTKNVDSTTGNATDALNKVPSVNVDTDGNVTLRGNSNVKIYVDGKPSVMLSGDNRAAALQAMSSSDIQSVEVMTNPGAQYSSEGSGGIINLVMKKNRKPGGSGVINANIGSDGRYNGAFSGSYRQGKTTWSGGLNTRHDIFDASLTSVQQALSGGVATRTTTSSGAGAMKMNAISGNFGVEYAASDADTYSVQGNYANRNRKSEGDIAYNTTGTTTSAYNQHATGQGPHEDSMLDFNWSHTGDKPGETLKTDLRISRSDGDSNSANTDVYSLPTVMTTNDTQHQSTNQKNAVLSVDYTRNVGTTGQLSAGTQITYDDSESINNATGANAANLTSDFAYKQTNTALYVTYQQQLGDKWTVLGGVRSETLDLKTDLVSSNSTGHINYTKLSPSFFATYAISGTSKIRFSYSHRLQRPAPQDLNPFQTYVDPQNVNAGNPNLKPQETDQFQLGYEYTKGFISGLARVYYAKNTHAITSYSYYVTPDVLLTTKRNYGDSQSGGLEFNLNTPLSKKLMVTTNGNLAYNEINTPGLGGTQSATTLSGRVGLIYKATTADTFQGFAFSSGKQLTGQGYRAPFSMANISYKHTFNPKLALVMNVNDPFRMAQMKVVTDTPTLHSEQIRHIKAQAFYIGLSYTLGGVAPAAQQQQGPGQGRWNGPGGDGPRGGPGGPGGGM
ncbi:TonB-dependent receptor domain-containing protein [Asticcacaulis solisilvae]|uniref:TonB-dependent receptor domain-containing protein n=1 Tax=Asticcacaulis solisilvae TaxID=1217274 RepID=UPI003FD7F50B